MVIRPILSLFRLDREDVRTEGRSINRVDNQVLLPQFEKVERSVHLLRGSGGGEDHSGFSDTRSIET